MPAPPISARCEGEEVMAEFDRGADASPSLGQIRSRSYSRNRLTLCQGAGCSDSAPIIQTRLMSVILKSESGCQRTTAPVCGATMHLPFPA